MGVVYDSVDDSGSRDLVAEDSAPIFEVSVRGKDCGFVLISVPDDLEEVVECLWV